MVGQLGNNNRELQQTASLRETTFNVTKINISYSFLEVQDLLYYKISQEAYQPLYMVHVYVFVRVSRSATKWL